MNKICCFTGHRPKSLPWGYNENKKECISFKDYLKKEIVRTIECGVDCFFTGMAEGFDMIAAEIVIELKKSFSQIKLIAVIPCLNQEIKWSKIQQKRYHQILCNCDDKIVLSNKYTSTCMNDRNRFMIEHSLFVIACFNGKSGGTKNTLIMAKEKGLKIKIINPNEFI